MYKSLQTMYILFIFYYNSNKKRKLILTFEIQTNLIKTEHISKVIDWKIKCVKISNISENLCGELNHLLSGSYFIHDPFLTLSNIMENCLWIRLVCLSSNVVRWQYNWYTLWIFTMAYSVLKIKGAVFIVRLQGYSKEHYGLSNKTGF